MSRFPSDDLENDDFDPDLYENVEDDNFDPGLYENESALFADPGGNSALRAASSRNPRNLPCPTCGEPNRLTPADQRNHYQCDDCADSAERGW